MVLDDILKPLKAFNCRADEDNVVSKKDHRHTDSVKKNPKVGQDQIFAHVDYVESKEHR